MENRKSTYSNKQNTGAEQSPENPVSRPEIKSMSLPELTEYILQIGQPRFRAAQIYRWIHLRHVDGYEQMTDIPFSLQQKLVQQTEWIVLKKEQMQSSMLDGTRKYLFRLPDGNMIESVLMRYRHGNSVCISSQVGCRMGCTFCASTLDGWVRNLTPSEMLEQVYRIQKDTNERVSNVVVMGVGEPLDNYDNLVKFIHMLSDENGMHISQRNITVSTCGLVPQILKLKEENLQITLALSLHAATDEKRKKLMPVARRYTIAEVLEACDAYFAKTGRRISFEYSLAKGVNDTREDAEALGALLRGKNCHVNLIPINPVKERHYQASLPKNVRDFRDMLENLGINVTIRRTLGSDIDGACGQLRKKYGNSNP